ncbi:MAG: GntR family transcriptional regulator [Clostridia bacterium]|nr:GntR family transcriptional regulator [Clostridia bacterium]
MTITQKIYGDLKSAILSGKYAAGALLTENQLARSYGVSKSPARSALHLLVRDCFIRPVERRGYMVLNINEHDVHLLNEVKYNTESYSVRQIIAACSEEEIRTLYDIIYLDAPTDKSFVYVNSQFHMHMARLTQNPYHIAIMEQLTRHAEALYGAQFWQSNPEQSGTQHYHAEIVDAMLRRDLNMALIFLKKDLALAPSFPAAKPAAQHRE